MKPNKHKTFWIMFNSDSCPVMDSYAFVEVTLKLDSDEAMKIRVAKIHL